MLDEKPRVVSFHFGVPSAKRIHALHGERILPIVSTSVNVHAILTRFRG
jgi:hypothetical protein